MRKCVHVFVCVCVCVFVCVGMLSVPLLVQHTQTNRGVRASGASSAGSGPTTLMLLERLLISFLGFFFGLFVCLFFGCKLLLFYSFFILTHGLKHILRIPFFFGVGESERGDTHTHTHTHMHNARMHNTRRRPAKPAKTTRGGRTTPSSARERVRLNKSMINLKTNP